MQGCFYYDMDLPNVKNLSRELTTALAYGRAEIADCAPALPQSGLPLTVYRHGVVLMVRVVRGSAYS